MSLTAFAQLEAGLRSVILLLALGLVLLAIGIIIVATGRRTHGTQRLHAALLQLGEARGRQAVLDEVRMLEHAQLKAHVMAVQRCLAHAQAAAGADEVQGWLAEGAAQAHRLLQVVVGLHHAAGDSALPGDLEQAARDTVASLAVAYPACTCTLEVCGRPVAAPGALVRRAAILVLYNALHNAYTHGRPSQVVVQLQYAPDALILVVRDNGAGGAWAASDVRSGRGLDDMQQLVRCCGGACVIDSAAGDGTTVTATFPLPMKGEADVSAQQTLATAPDDDRAAGHVSTAVASRRDSGSRSGARGAGGRCRRSWSPDVPARACH